MAPGYTPWTHCFILLAAIVIVTSGDVLYILEVSTDGPITSGAQARINATLFIKNGSTTLTADSRLYDFHWSYSPLELTHQSENESASAINVLSKFPGSYPISVWVTLRQCHLCQPIASTKTHLQVTKSIVGSITAVQVEGNSATFRRGSVLATDCDVELSFLLHDPSGYFRTAVFSYRWNLGDGYETKTNKPFVHYTFSTPRRYKVTLEVSARMQSSSHDRHTVQKTGSFKADFTLLDVLRNITVTGSREARTGQTFNATLHFFGSSPLAVCWLIKSDCVSLDGDKCHQVELNGTTHSIIHVFSSAGRYCLSTWAQNGVSTLKDYHSITVYPAGWHHIWFIFPCGAFIGIALGFIFFTMLRSGSNAGAVQHKSQVEVADFDFSPDPEKYQPLPEYRDHRDPTPGNACWIFCATANGQDERETRLEKQPLLSPSLAPTRSYTM